jgi:hypothetical protein
LEKEKEFKVRKTNQTLEAEDSDRPKRVPINGSRDILKVKGIPPNLHPCWVNDVDNNLERYQAAGYYFWIKPVAVGDNKIDSDSPMGSGVISKNVGNGVTAYLMVVPVEYYDEDMAAQQKDLSDREAILFRNLKQGEGRYGNVQVDTKLGVVE